MEAFDFGQLRVLVVEDDEFARQMLIRILDKIGVAASMSTANGREALQMIESGSFAPHIVLCDLRMPEIDGFGFLDAVRDGDRPGIDPALPIIIISSADDQESARRAARQGVDGYIIKPVAMKRLKLEVEQVIRAYAMLAETETPRLT